MSPALLLCHRVLHAIPPNEAIDTVEVVSDPIIYVIGIVIIIILIYMIDVCRNLHIFLYVKVKVSTCTFYLWILLCDCLLYMVQVLQSRTNPTFVPWKGGAVC